MRGSFALKVPGTLSVPVMRFTKIRAAREGVELLASGLDVSDDRLAALVHIDMLNPYELRAAVSEAAKSFVLHR